MPPEIRRITEQFLHNPVRVEVAKPATTVTTTTQQLVKTGREPHDKRETLRRLLRSAEGLKNAIVFCNRKRDVDIVYKSLRKHGFNVGALHGDLDQSVRMQVLDGFRANEIQILIASDVAARGLDIPNVSHVYNFDVPIHSEDYVHRIGRTGRAGRSGSAFMLCLPFEEKHLDKIETLVGQAIERIPSPLGENAPDESEPEAEARDDSEAQKPRRRRSRRSGRNQDEAAEKPAEAPREEAAAEPAATPRREKNREDRSGRPRGRKNRGEERDEPVVGLGDHVPAFLLRPVFVKKSAASDDEDEPSAADDETAETHAPA
jgi:superfamily II DNA/RNA helicase